MTQRRELLAGTQQKIKKGELRIGKSLARDETVILLTLSLHHY